MALTFIQQQITNYPAYNPIVYVISSTISGSDSFKYVCDVKLDGSTIATLKTVPDPTYGYGLVETGQIAQTYLGTTFNTGSTFFSSKSGNRQFSFEFAEEWTSGSSYIKTAAQISSSIYIWNGALNLQEWEDIGNNNYVITTTSDAKPLTSTTNKSTSYSAKQWLYFLCSDQAGARYLYIEPYVNNASVGTYRLTMPGGLQDTAELRMFGAQCGLKYLLTTSPSQVTATSAITTYGSNIKKYDVWIANSSGTRTSKKVTYTIDEYCDSDKYTEYALYYINRFGGIDTAVFKGLTRKSTTIERDSYTRKAGSLIQTGYKISSDDPIKRDYNIKYNNSLALTTMFMQENEQEFYVDLYTSPFIWLDKPTTTSKLQAANVTDTEFIQKNKINGIPYLTVNIEISEDLRRQRV